MPTEDQTAAPAPEAPPEDTPKETPGKTFTQEEVGRMIAQARAPYKEKADNYDKLLESQKSDTQKQAERVAELERTLASYQAGEKRRAAAQAAKLPAEAAALVTGETEEQIAESVKQISALLATVGKPRPIEGEGTPPNQSTKPEDEKFVLDLFK